jgi:hypothetical protein
VSAPSVIAHFSRLSSLIASAIFLLICGYFLYLLLHRLPVPYDDIYRLQYIATLAGLLCVCALAARSCAMLYQMAFHGGAAIWIAGETVIFLDTLFGIWFEQVPLRDIASVSVGPIGRAGRQGLIFNLRDGTRKATRILFLAEAPEIVMSRLESHISPPHPERA